MNEIAKAIKALRVLSPENFKLAVDLARPDKPVNRPRRRGKKPGPKPGSHRRAKAAAEAPAPVRTRAARIPVEAQATV